MGREPKKRQGEVRGQEADAKKREAHTSAPATKAAAKSAEPGKADKGAGAHASAAKAARPAGHAKASGRVATELSRQAGLIACAVVLMAACVFALAWPAWGIQLGTLLGGGTSVRLAVTGSDGAAASGDDVEAALKVAQRRADALAERDVHVVRSGDAELTVQVPGGYDAQAVAQALTGTGSFELVRVDTISDADAIAQLSAGTTGVELKEGSYTAFATSDNVRSAGVVTSQSTSAYSAIYNLGPVYAVGMKLDDAGAQALEQASDELSGSNGRLAVVIDRTIVTAPQVSSKIEGGEVTFSGGFTEDQAHELAAKIQSGPLPDGVTLAVGETAPLSAALGANTVALACALVAGLALVLGALVALALHSRAGWAVTLELLGTAVLSLGALAVIAHLSLVALGTWTLGGLGIAAVAALGLGVAAALGYARQRREGASVRKAQQEGFAIALLPACAVVVLAVAAMVAALFLAPDPQRQLVLAAASGIVCALVARQLVAVPLGCVICAGDAARTQGDVVRPQGAQGGAKPAGSGE